MNVSLRRASRPWCGAITSLVGLIPFRRHYALLLNRGMVEPGLHPAERAGLSNSLFAERGKPCSEKIQLQGGKHVTPARSGELRPEVDFVLTRSHIEPPQVLSDLYLQVGDVMESNVVAIHTSQSL